MSSILAIYLVFLFGTKGKEFKKCQHLSTCLKLNISPSFQNNFFIIKQKQNMHVSCFFLPGALSKTTAS